MERKSSQGGWCGGSQPFAYRAVKGEGRLEVDEDEAPLIPVIFDLYANKRLGSHAIANQLTAAGLSTRSARPWQFKSILNAERAALQAELDKVERGMFELDARR
jgi:hypothetical protein